MAKGRLLNFGHLGSLDVLYNQYTHHGATFRGQTEKKKKILHPLVISLIGGVVSGMLLTIFKSSEFLSIGTWLAWITCGFSTLLLINARIQEIELEGKFLADLTHVKLQPAACVSMSMEDIVSATTSCVQEQARKHKSMPVRNLEDEKVKEELRLQMRAMVDAMVRLGVLESTEIPNFYKGIYAKLEA